MPQPSRTRRSVLASTGIAAVAALAGCLNGDDDPPETDGEAEPEAEPEPENEDENGTDEYQLVTELLIYDEDDGSDIDIADVVDGGQWFGQLPTLSVGDTVTLRAEFIDSEGDAVPLGSDETYTLRTELADGAPDDVVSIADNADTVDLTGDAEGEAEIVFQLYDGSAAEWESPPIPATVES